MKKNLLLIISILIVISMGGCSEKGIYIDESESFFSKYTIEDGMVYIECELLVKNSTGSEKVIEIIGHFDKDVENGLLKNGELNGYQGEKREIVISGGESWITVVFRGEHAGGDKKYDRNLPEIQIISKDVK